MWVKKNYPNVDLKAPEVCVKCGRKCGKKSLRMLPFDPRCTKLARKTAAVGACNTETELKVRNIYEPGRVG